MQRVDFAKELVPADLGPVDRAYQYVAGLIDLKRVPHGALLPRAGDLAKEIGVSRPSMLTALALLEEHGLVRVGNGRAGVRVQEQIGAGKDARVAWLYDHRQTISEMATLRAAVEPVLMRIAADNGLNRSQRSQARKLHEEMRGTSLDHQGYLAADTEFHRVLASAIGAASIERLLLIVRRWVAPAIDLVPWPPNRRAASNAEHEILLTAIESRDAAATEAAAREHLGSTTQRIQDLLDGMDSPTRSRQRRQ